MNLTQQAKIALLQYCRFKRQYHYVATEVVVPGGCTADVLASNGENLVEYEIKVSMSDFMSDFKKPKHAIYSPLPIVWDGLFGSKGSLKFEIADLGQNHSPGYSVFLLDENGDRFNLRWAKFKTIEEAKEFFEGEYGKKSDAPNTLYYVIPKELWELGKDKILAKLPKEYGVITFKNAGYSSMWVEKTAKKLHKNKVAPHVLGTLAARMSSELASLTHLFHTHLETITSIAKQHDFDTPDLMKAEDED